MQKYFQKIIKIQPKLLKAVVESQSWILMLLIYSLIVSILNINTGLQFLLIILFYLFSIYIHELSHILAIFYYDLELIDIIVENQSIKVKYTEKNNNFLIAIAGVLSNFTIFGICFIYLILLYFMYKSNFIILTNNFPIFMLMIFNLILCINILPNFPDGKLLKDSLEEKSNEFYSKKN